MTAGTNVAVSECRCFFSDKRWHDDLLAIETDSALLGWVVTDLIERVADEWKRKDSPVS
jgi:hypothetical protein